jgi:hypothetical protein
LKGQGATGGCRADDDEDDDDKIEKNLVVKQLAVVNL